MKVDLKKVLQASPDVLESRVKLKSVMKDLYPDEKREINILLNVFESGIPSVIAKKGSIEKLDYDRYVNDIANDYGMEKECVKEALDQWISCFGGKVLVSSKMGNTPQVSQPAQVTQPQQINQISKRNFTILPKWTKASKTSKPHRTQHFSLIVLKALIIDLIPALVLGIIAFLLFNKYVSSHSMLLFSFSFYAFSYSVYFAMKSILEILVDYGGDTKSLAIKITVIFIIIAGIAWFIRYVVILEYWRY